MGYEIGEELVLFQSSYKKTPLTLPYSWDDVVAQLILIRIKIVGTRADVPGDYCPERFHHGYLAYAEEQNLHYGCQWKKFDDCSMDPYNNWTAQFEEGVHYTKSLTSVADGFKAGMDFKEPWSLDQYLNWRLSGHSTSYTVQEHLRKDMSDADRHGEIRKFVAALNKRVAGLGWPDGLQLDLCDVKHGDQVADGLRYGPHFRQDGCSFCALLAKHGG